MSPITPMQKCPRSSASLQSRGVRWPRQMEVQSISLNRASSPASARRGKPLLPGSPGLALLPCAPLPQEHFSSPQIQTGGNLLLPLQVLPPSLFSGSINKVAVQMENCKKTCLQGLVKPGPWSLLLPCLVWGSSSPWCCCCVCKEHAGGFNMWAEGLPYPPKQNGAGVERTFFQKKCGLFLVCGMAGTSKLRHLRSWPGVPAQGPPRASGAPTGHPRNSYPVTCTSSASESSKILAALYHWACAWYCP